jgi:hypothetical protein
MPVDVRVPGGFEQAVAFAQGYIERLSQNQHRLTTRLRSSGLDETDMTAVTPRKSSASSTAARSSASVS